MPAPIRFINPEGLVRPAAYTQLVEVAGGSRMLYVSGHLETALAAVGASFADVAKVNSFLADIAHLPILREVRARHLDAAALPASTTIAVSGFALPGALLEVEAVAVVPPTP